MRARTTRCSAPSPFATRGLAWAAALVAALVFAGCPPKPEPKPEPEPLTIVELDVGLDAAQRTVWRFTSEGSDLAPVALLRALRDVNTGELFPESLEHYGFLPSPASPANPCGLPVGWAVSVPEYSILNLDYVGVNCSACHTGQIDYAGRGLRIDGAPNLADIEAFGLAVKDSAVHLLGHPVEALLFVWRLIHLEPPEPDGTQDFAGILPEETHDFLEIDAEALSNDVEEPEDALGRELGESFTRLLAGESEPEAEEAELLEEGFAGLVAESTASAAHVSEGDASGGVLGVLGHLRNLCDFVDKYEALLKNRIELGVRAIHAFETSPVPGPGRDDPWGIIRNLLFYTETELTAPTSIPHLYYAREFGWYHADGNTNSVMQRNIAQAVALGAFVDADTHQSTLLPRRIWVLEDQMARLRSPAWPEDVFGALDREKAALGEELFHRKLTVPDDPGSNMAGAPVACSDCHAARQGKLFTLEAMGTDPNRARNFLRPQGDEPFWVAIPQAVGEIESVAYEISGITPEEAKEHEYADPPEWRGTGKYIARQLDGVWSSAPYLHNGSVPTLYDLLLPPAERPSSFPLGQRDYDPERVGYTTQVDDPIFVYDTTANGSANTGHPFGTDLSENERWALVEYLKTL